MNTKSGPNWTLYNGNSLEWMRTNRFTQPASFDAVITDPPYCSTKASSSSATSKKYQQSGSAKKYPEFMGDTLDPRAFTSWCAEWMSMAHELTKPGGYLLCFSDWRRLPQMSDAIQWAGWTYRGVAIWDKGLASRSCGKGWFRFQSEMILWATKGTLQPRNGTRVYPGVFQHQVNAKEKLHMTGKPIALMSDLVSIVAPGDRVLDPFAGSASTGVACLKHGVEFVGCEMSKDYFAISCDRLATTSHVMSDHSHKENRNAKAKAA
jgi:site-specific DNA-methyltransferase (adenine-specific)